MPGRELSQLEIVLRRSITWSLSEAEIRVLVQECQSLEEVHKTLLEYSPEFKDRVTEEQKHIEDPFLEAYLEEPDLDALIEGGEEEE
jgi:hypothetical protein